MAWLARLPIAEEDPIKRLELVREVTTELKTSGSADPTSYLYKTAEFGGPAAVSLVVFDNVSLGFGKKQIVDELDLRIVREEALQPLARRLGLGRRHLMLSWTGSTPAAPCVSSTNAAVTGLIGRCCRVCGRCRKNTGTPSDFTFENVTVITRRREKRPSRKSDA